MAANGSEWQLALGLLSWSAANGSGGQLALGLLCWMDANGSALLLKRLVYAYVAADVAAAWDADVSACPGADNRMSTTRLVLVIAATNAAVHGYGGPWILSRALPTKTRCRSVKSTSCGPQQWRDNPGREHGMSAAYRRARRYAPA